MDILFLSMMHYKERQTFYLSWYHGKQLIYIHSTHHLVESNDILVSRKRKTSSHDVNDVLVASKTWTCQSEKDPKVGEPWLN